MVRSVLLLIIFIFYKQNAYASKSHHLEVEIGQSINIYLEKSDQVDVSKKGIVDLFYHRQSRQWQVTALKKGFVAIRPEHHDDDRYYIQVITKLNEKKHGGCMEGDCLETKVVDLLYNDPFQFYADKKSCERKHQCFFFASLNKKALHEWRFFLQAIFNDAQITVNDRGYGDVVSKCLSKSGIESEKSLAGKYDLTFSCQHEIQQENFLFQAKIMVLSKNHTTQFGIGHQLTVPPFRLDANLLKSLEENNHIKLLGAASARLLPGVESNLVSGGEIKNSSITSVQGETDIWKQYGMSLQVVLQLGRKNQVYLEYKVSVRNPGTSDRQQFQLSRMDGKALLDLSDEQVIGRFTVNSDKTSKDGLPFVSQVPIIGPIFKGFHNGNSQEEMIVTFSVHPDRSINSSKNPELKQSEF